MRLRKPLLQLLVYLLPAMTVLIAYSAYHETLFQKPACRINCENLATESGTQKSIQNTLDLIDELARYKADLMRQAHSLFNSDLAFLQTRLNMLGNDYDSLTRYGDGFLHHSWARLNSEMNAKIQDYLNQSQASYFLGEALQALNNGKKSMANANKLTQRTNLASSDLPATDGLIPRILTKDFLSPGSNYLVSPSALSTGRGGSGSDPSSPPINSVPLPNGIYLMISALLLYGLFKYKPTLRSPT